MAYPRTLAEIEALEPTEAERKLLDACRAGEMCILGPDRPEGPSPERNIRAEILRYLILGGCTDHPGTERGVCLIGAYVEGELNLDWTAAVGSTYLRLCRFQRPVSLSDASLRSLSLSGSHLPGLNAQGAEVTGDVFLRAQGATPFHATGEVRLSGARIEGQLACDGGRFENAGGDALNAQGAEVTGGVFLCAEGDTPFHATGEVRLSGARIEGQLGCNGGRFENAGKFALNAQGTEVTGDVFLRTQGDTPFHATGEVSLSGARIGGQLSCGGARFENAGGFALNAEGAEVTGDVFLSAQGATPFHTTGEVRLSGARIEGSLGCEGARFETAGGVALNAQRVRVAQSLVWWDVKAGDGLYSFDAAHAGDLVDDVALWPDKGLILDGFTYDRIVGATDAAARLDWLAKGTRFGGEFYPQPYGQCARVLREMGHGREARRILYERERLLRAEARKRTLFLRPVLWFWNGLERWVVGYGLKPARSLIVALGLWAACTLLAHLAWNAGEMAPNAGPLLSQQEWQTAYATDNPPEDWAATAVGTSWEKFSPVFYGFDVVVPLIEIGQTSAWGPMVDDSKPIGWGYVLWRAQWVFGVAGWVVALLATAGLTGALSSRKD